MTRRTTKNFEDGHKDDDFIFIFSSDTYSTQNSNPCCFLQGASSKQRLHDGRFPSEWRGLCGGRDIWRLNTAVLCSFGIRKVLGCIRCPFSFDILMCFFCGDGAGRVVELRESHIKNHTLVPERAMEQRNEVETARLEFQQAGNIRNSTSSELQLRYNI